MMVLVENEADQVIAKMATIKTVGQLSKVDPIVQTNNALI
jgi:hypothetical protein